MIHLWHHRMSVVPFFIGGGDFMASMYPALLIAGGGS